jgi:hypothetical protein
VGSVEFTGVSLGVAEPGVAVLGVVGLGAEGGVSVPSGSFAESLPSSEAHPLSATDTSPNINAALFISESPRLQSE